MQAILGWKKSSDKVANEVLIDSNHQESVESQTTEFVEQTAKL
jgi:hypothetical protein